MRAHALLITAVLVASSAALGRWSANTSHRQAIVRGEAVFQASQCTVCHRLGEYGGSNGPDLSKVGAKFVKIKGSEKAATEWFYLHVTDPEKWPGPEKRRYRFVRMPRFNLTEAQRRDIAAYLLTLGTAPND